MATKNTDMGITLTGLVDLSQARKDIEAFTNNKGENRARKIKFDADINLNEINNKLENAINKNLIKKVDDSMTRVSTKIKNEFKTITQTMFDDDGNEFEQKIKVKLTRVTETFKNEFGKIQERVSVFDDTMKPVTSSIQTLQQGIKELGTETNTSIQKIGDLNVKVTTYSETIKDTANQTTKITTTTKEWLDEENKLNQEIVKTVDDGKNIKQVGAVLTNVTDDTKKATKFMNELAQATKQVAQPKTDKTSTVTYVDKDGVKTVVQLNNGIKTLTTTTREYTTAQGALVKETKELNHVTGDTKIHTEVVKNKQEEIQKSKELEKQLEQERLARKKLNEITTGTTSIERRGKITDWETGKEYEGIITTIKTVDAEGKKAIRTIEQFTNAENQLVEQTRVLDENNQRLVNDQRNVTSKLNESSEAANKASNANKNLSESSKQAAQSQQTLGQSLTKALSTLAQYYVASLPIRAFREAVSEAVTTVREFDSALIEFRKVSDLAGESLTQYVAKLAEMGEITGSTMQAMVEASTEFRKSGFSDEDSAKLASIAEKYRNVADEEISAGEAASFIIAQMKAFNIEAGQAEHIIDAVNEVANNFSVSSADLARNLGNMSEIMAINNVTLEQQVGMLTGVTEITRNASSASRGLVMISSRLTQVLDDTSSTGKKLTQIYADLGIELKDENGQLRSHYEILGDLAKKWNTLSENQQKYIALTSAGARQQQNFVALMDNWSNVAQATAKAYDSMGSAQRENEKVMDSIAKKVEILKSEFQQLVIGKGGLQDFVKNILNAGISLLKFANSDIGKVVIASTTFLGVIKLISVALKTELISGLIETVRQMMLTATMSGVATTSISAFGYAVKELTLSFIENAIAWASTPFGMITVAVAAVTILTAAFIKYGNRAHEAAEKTKELADEANNLKSDIKGLESDLNSIQEKIEEINKQKLEITSPQQLIELEKQTKELETQEIILQRQIELEKQKLDLAQKDATAQALKAKDITITTHFNQEKADIYSSDYLYGYEPTEQVTWAEELSRATEKTQELIAKRNELITQAKGVAQQEGETSQAYKSQQEQIADLQTQIDEATSVGHEAAEAIEQITSGLYGNEEEVVKTKKEYGELLDAWNETYNKIEENNEVIEKSEEGLEAEAEELEELDKELTNLLQSLGLTESEFRALQSTFGDDTALLNYLQQLQQVKQEISDTNTVIDNLQEAMTVAQAALDEYSASGSLTVDTFQSLMNISAQYLTALVNENGQLEINQTTLGNLINKLKQAKIEELQAAETADILAYAQGNVSDMSVLAQQSVTNAGNAAYTAGQNAQAGATGFWTLADALAAANKAANGATVISDRNIQRIHNSYSKLAKQISDIKVDTTKAGQATSKAASGAGKAAKSAGGAASKAAKEAGKAATDAGKATEKAAQDAKKAIQDEVKALEDKKSKYDRVIKWIEKQYDKQIDKIKKAKEEALEAIEAQIKAKEKQKDKELDAIEKQINALEKEKDKRKEYWDAQIDALKKANKEKKDALELQEKLDALEKAKSTKVKIYKEGQGFVYDVDQTAVQEAQKALDEYLSEKAYEEELQRLEDLRDAELKNYEERIKALDEYKDRVQESYEKQIENLKAYKEQVEANYDAQIEMYENYKQKFEDMVNAYEEEQDRLLALELAGIDAENNNWMTRLDNLQNFVNSYHDLLRQIEDAKARMDAVTSSTPSVGGGGGGDSTTPTSSGGGTSGNVGGGNNNNNTRTVTNQDYPYNQYTPNPEHKKQTKFPTTATRGTPYHAKGIDTIPNDEIAIVGDAPNQELVIGSKLNGKLMSLNKGDGVVNAESSKTLAGMLNQIGKYGASGFGSGNGTLNNNINNDSLTINGVTIQGADIKDPQTFVNGLLNLKAEALQRAYSHK